MNEKDQRLGESGSKSRYLLEGSRRKEVESYTFVVNSYVRACDAPEATELFIAAVTPAIWKTIGKRDRRALPSSCRCHAAFGAERRQV
jgi:hypothetical protein